MTLSLDWGHIEKLEVDANVLMVQEIVFSMKDFTVEELCQSCHKVNICKIFRENR